jgi:hypothetical protein
MFRLRSSTQRLTGPSLAAPGLNPFYALITEPPVVFQVSYYVADKSESSIILFIASCFILFAIAAADAVALQYCLHLPECQTMYIHATPIIIMVVEPLLALAGCYVAVFKTAYEPRKPREKNQWVSLGKKREHGSICVTPREQLCNRSCRNKHTHTHTCQRRSMCVNMCQCVSHRSTGHVSMCVNERERERERERAVL